MDVIADPKSVPAHGYSNSSPGGPNSFGGNLDVIMKIPVCVKVVLGATSMPVSALLKLGRGAVIPLDRKVGDPVEVVVNDHVVARGEVVVINEDGSRFGISLTEIAGTEDEDRI
jgi:flagellar motor switch protein FliN